MKRARPIRTLTTVLVIAALAALWAGFLRHARRAELADTKWSLWTDGTQLRGANVYQRRTYPGLGDRATMGDAAVGPAITADDIRLLAAAGANYVNISHPGIFRESPPYAIDHDMLGNLDRLVSLAASNHLWAVISFRTGPGRSEFSILRAAEDSWFPSSLVDDNIWFRDNAQRAWAAMWQATARHFAGRANVAGYQLMVEPNANSCVRGGPVWDRDVFYQQYGGHSVDWNRLYPKVVRAIRKADRHTPILVPCENHASPYWLDRLIPCDDRRTVYTVSLYEPFDYTHQPVAPPAEVSRYPGWVRSLDAPQESNWVDRAWIERLVRRIDMYSSWHGVPVTVGEVGVQRWQPGAARYMRHCLAGLEDHGMGYAHWLWECRDPRYADTVTAFNFRLGPDPENVSEVRTNALRETIEAFWNRNTMRPQS